MNVEINKLRRMMAYLAIIESVSLDEIIWMDNNKVINIDKKDIEEWKFTGLNNRDFAEFKIKL